MKWNGLRSTNLQIGQTLKIEGGASAASQTKSETQTIQNSSSGTKHHLVQSGDTFWKIAQKHGTTVDAIQRLNPGVKSSDLKIGQKIRVQ